LRFSEECFPRHRGYLAADRQMRQMWWRRLSDISDLPKVGIAWRGNGPLSDERSTRLEQWADLLSPQIATYVSLQSGNCQEELAIFNSRQGAKIHSWPEIAVEGNLDQQAALISALDLVISVPNTVVHLSGALGIATWNLLAWSSSWRWMLKRDDSPWYPSMRLFRPSRPGGWDGVFDRLQRELRSLGSASPPLRGPHRRSVPTHLKVDATRRTR
jgi:hypothetical protein